MQRLFILGHRRGFLLALLYEVGPCLSLRNGAEECIIDNIDGSMQYVFLKDGLKEGLEREWYSNGQLSLERNWREGKEEGLERVWLSNGRLLVECQFLNGKKEGIERWWRLDGSVRELEWEDGRLVTPPYTELLPPPMPAFSVFKLLLQALFTFWLMEWLNRQLKQECSASSF